MKITLDELKSYSLYDNLPEKLKRLKSGEYYCFYYTVDYDNSKIVIVKDFLAVNLNTSLYRDVFKLIKQENTNEIFLGYFTNKFETRDGLFYLMINSLFTKESISDLYAYASDKDSKNDLKILNSASIDIYSRDSFSDSLAYFMHPDKINTVLSIYDIVDDFLKNNSNTTLYGGIIKRVVQMVTHDSGVMSDENGYLRYMIIGEKAVLTDSQKEKLKTAKSLLRSLINTNDIYIQTGWYYNVNDGLWRTNTSDKDSDILENFIVRVNDSLSVYKPTYNPVNQEQLLTNLNKPQYLLNLGYNGKLSDILKHDNLYYHYPQLAQLPLFFAYSNANIFYHSELSDGYSFINIQGDKKTNHILSILLHETQHAVQSIEGFAKGGNSHFADFVIALGGKSVRTIFASISAFQKFISSRVNNEYLFNSMKDAISEINAVSNTSKSLKSNLIEYMSSYDVFRANTSSVGFYLIYLISDTKVFNEGAIIDFLEEHYGDEIYEVFELIKDGIDSSNRASEKLLSEGFTKEDVRIINFNTYQNLLGEMEARGTQHQMRIPVNLSNYFFLNEWEKSPTKSVAVIGGNYVFNDTSKIVGACEKSIDGKYILHFKKNISSIPFIHELGHIVHDILVERGFGDVIKNEYEIEVVYDDYQEWFVNVFLGYLSEYYNDSLIGKDLSMDFNIKKNKIVFELLSDIFSPKPKEYENIKSFINKLEDLSKK